MSDTDTDEPRFLTAPTGTAGTHSSPDDMASWLAQSPGAAVMLKELASVRHALGRLLPLTENSNLTPEEKTRISNELFRLRRLLEDLAQ